jgi:hypothetical protein
MDELNRRKATAYTHPNDPACCLNIASGVPPVIIEYGTDTTRTIASLVFSGTAQTMQGHQLHLLARRRHAEFVTERFLVQAVSFPGVKERVSPPRPCSRRYAGSTTTPRRHPIRGDGRPDQVHPGLEHRLRNRLPLSHRCRACEGVGRDLFRRRSACHRTRQRHANPPGHEAA